MAAADVPLADTLGRPVRDLRISVTDRCQTMVGIHRRKRQILRPARLPGGAAKTGPLPYDTEYVASYVVTGR
jgi:hypothetical protein